jgi:ClpP class serine protease
LWRCNSFEFVPDTFFQTFMEFGMPLANPLVRKGRSNSKMKLRFRSAIVACLQRRAEQWRRNDGLNLMETQNVRDESEKRLRSMRPSRHRWWHRLPPIGKFAFWLIVAYMVVQQIFGPYWTTTARASVLDQFQQQRKSRVIAMIHRQETISLFGVPVSSYIDIEDSEAVLRAIRLTPPDQPIDMILHTPGGLVLAAEQIAKALVEHKGKVTVFVPHYAMSGGTLIALAAHEIVMDANAVLGPVDPQIGDMPAASILRVLNLKQVNRIRDETLELADVAAKARLQVAGFVTELLLNRLPKDKAVRLATVLTEGRWTHDFPITVELARELGLSVSTEMPRIVYELMDLFPQGGADRPSVLYVPLHRSPAGRDEAPDSAPASPAKKVAIGRGSR